MLQVCKLIYLQKQFCENALTVIFVITNNLKALFGTAHWNRLILRIRLS